MRLDNPEDKQGSGTSPNRGSSLHTKLQAIVKDDTMAYEVDEKVAHIMTAFQEAGYRHVHHDPEQWANLMTGQEFYDRFKAELDNATLFPTSRGEALKLAGRAAGVSDE